MPPADSVSDRLRTCVLAFEDKRFYQHIGVDPHSIGRALRDNFRAGRVVSGGSTITMQVARMARGNRARTLVQKFLEAIVATRLEVTYGKREILNLWLTHAPFGGNIVGVEAASLRYFGRAPADLSWAEAATLAVLPNSPALIHPGRSRDALRDKRDRLLRKLDLPAEELDLALSEPLPAARFELPDHAPHLLQRLRRERGDGRLRSTLDGDLQRRLEGTVREYANVLARNQIHNAAVLVTDVATREVVAYVGNVPGLAREYAPSVDIVTAPRSPGSLLKPILYASALEAGKLLPRQFLADLPISFGSFQPANFHRQFDGLVPADEALARSLNIPFVFLLRDYGVPGFHAALQDYGFRQMPRTPDHYGLSLILGGAEVTMEEINGWFLGLARQQRFFYERQGRYDTNDWGGPLLVPAVAGTETPSPDPLLIGAGAGFRTLEALTELRRPDEEGNYRSFDSHQRIAWKTGTSFGFRDAWAVGATPEYVVSVWTGNASGEGRAGLVGVRAAAPLLFQIFRLLRERSADGPGWFEPPYDELREVVTCSVSGMLASQDCPLTREWVPKNAERGDQCGYHQRMYLDAGQRYQLRAGCDGWPERVMTERLVLPTREGYFYQRAHPEYQPPPAFAADCAGGGGRQPALQFVYPLPGGRVRAARDWRGQRMPIVVELAHRDADKTVYWHIDGSLVGTTRTFHSLELPLAPGTHRLTVVDEDGQRAERNLEIE